MLTASPSPKHNTSPQSSSLPAFSSRSRYDTIRKSSISSSPIGTSHSAHVDSAPQPTQTIPSISQCSRDHSHGTSALTTTPAPPPGRRNMVDAGTQYSPPPGYRSPTVLQQTSIPQTTHTKLAEPSQTSIPPDVAMPTVPDKALPSTENPLNDTLSSTKRHASASEEKHEPRPAESSANEAPSQEQGPAKRARGEEQPLKIMPIKYETCDTRELVILISSMLMELIRYNDAIPLKEGHLTRFHSRAPPGISVLDYLQRLTTHATLPPPILLSMVYYIDKLCALYPAFTISSLTVHRFLITSATVASKGLSDSFWTNKTYARVGGVTVKELALLEMEFLVRVQWRIVPKPETLIEYYRSLVERSPGYEIEQAT